MNLCPNCHDSHVKPATSSIRKGMMICTNCGLVWDPADQPKEATRA